MQNTNLFNEFIQYENKKGESTMTQSESFTSENRFALALPENNPMPRCAVLLVLDTSHSMWGNGLLEMQESIRTFFQTLGHKQFFSPQVDIAAVGMGENLKVLENFTPMEKSSLPTMKIRPKGETPVGAALTLALETLRVQMETYRKQAAGCSVPQLILLSDGNSTDDFSAAAAAIRNMVEAGELECRAIVCGDDPDFDALKKIAGDHISCPRKGEMYNAFAQVGEIVSQTYEDQTEKILASQTAEPESDKCVDRFVLLDGSNIIHWTPDRSATLKYLLAITRELDAEKRPYLVFFDASARYRLPQSETAQFEALLRNDPTHFRQVPAGTCADLSILAYAQTLPESVIITNDLYREHAVAYPFVRDKEKLLHGMVFNDLIIFPQINKKILLAPEKAQ
ncbi:MAG: VWA domain-containing protein [Victivallaceae bacterium]|nr:VWA domain-containing protein [Victivallaceae bacterium]